MKMCRGVIAEIREFCLHDGPGVRTTVFFRGCPMRCLWCHNPELRSGGTEKSYLPSEAAEIIRRDEEILRSSGGGVTFSGGEVLAQADFAEALALELSPLHIAVETSGYGSKEAYRKMLKFAGLIYQDFKIADEKLHLRFTGCSSRIILENIRQLKLSGKPYIIRMPLIPGINDTPELLQKAIRFIQQEPGNLLDVQLLPYHAGAVSKMRRMGLPVPPELPENDGVVPEAIRQMFREAFPGLPASMA